jgi:hypothetical protein
MPNIRPRSRIAVPSGSSDWANQGADAERDRALARAMSDGLSGDS